MNIALVLHQNVLGAVHLLADVTLVLFLGVKPQHVTLEVIAAHGFTANCAHRSFEPPLVTVLFPAMGPQRCEVIKSFRTVLATLEEYPSVNSQ